MKYFELTAQLPVPKQVFVLIRHCAIPCAVLLACIVVTPVYASQRGGLPVYPHSVQTKPDQKASGFVSSLYESTDASGVVDAWYRGHLPACHRGSFSNGLIKYACPNGFVDVQQHGRGTIIEIVSKSI
jgi:hypothetical protein